MKARYITLAALLPALLLAGCSPEEFSGVSESGLALASSAHVKVTVDDETNAVTLTLEGDGVYPLWYLPADGKEIQKNAVYSTKNPFTKIWTNSGEYTAYYRVGNSNGLSQGMGSVTFTVANALTNYDGIVGKLAGKEWRIASDEVAHMGCGESGTDGTGWWSAQPNDKAGKGVYDDRLTFSSDYQYTYNPGTGGTVFVNTGCTIFSDYHADEDYMVPVESQTTTYSLTTEGDDVYIVFPAKTLFPYIPADEAYNNELRLRIESVTASKLVLVWDNGTIAWHYILTSASAGFQGFDASSSCNLFRNAEFTNTFYYAPGWSQIDDPVVSQDGMTYNVELPEATSDQWQAQVFFRSTVATQSSADYDFSVKLTSTTDLKGATIKLTQNGDDNNFYFTERVDLKANEEYIFYKSAMPGLDIDALNLVFDFGGNPASTTISIANICLEEHGCDGIEAPAEEEEPKDDFSYDATTSCNLWNSATYTNTFYYAPDWSQIADPDVTADGNKYTIDLPSATFQQWQAQVFFNTNLSTASGSTYDFAITMTSTTDHNGVTIKLLKTGDDDTFYFAEQVKLSADEPTIFHMESMAGLDADNISLVLDFGGNAEGTTVVVSNVMLKESNCAE